MSHTKWTNNLIESDVASQMGFNRNQFFSFLMTNVYYKQYRRRMNYWPYLSKLLRSRLISLSLWTDDCEWNGQQASEFVGESENTIAVEWHKHAANAQRQLSEAESFDEIINIALLEL